MIDLATPSDLAGLVTIASAAGQSQLFLALLAALKSTFAATPQHLSLLGRREGCSVEFNYRLAFMFQSGSMKDI